MKRRKRLRVVVALVLFAIHPAILAQSASNERWGGKWSTANRSSANAIRAWPSIRTGNAYDAVMDFDAVTRDPNESKKLLAAYDSYDHLHLNDLGYKAMAEAVDLRLFKTVPTSARTPRQYQGNTVTTKPKRQS